MRSMGRGDAIDAWLREAPAAPLPARLPAPVVVPVSATRVYKSWNGRRWLMLMAAFSGLLVACIAQALRGMVADTLSNLLFATGLVWAACAFIEVGWGRFALEPDGIATTCLWRTRRLAYADIGSYRVFRDWEQGVYLLSFIPAQTSIKSVWVTFDDEEIREPFVAGWLASLRRELGHIDPPLDDDDLGTAVGARAWRRRVMGLATIAGVAIVLLCVARTSGTFGPPIPLEGLDRISGTLVQSGPCVHVKGGGWTSAEIATSGGRVRTKLPCDLGAEHLDQRVNHAIEIWRDPRLLQHTSYPLELHWDGRVLQRYDDVLARRQASRWAMLGVNVFGGASMLCGLVVMLLRLRRRD
jgi:hypothetical protein